MTGFAFGLTVLLILFVGIAFYIGISFSVHRIQTNRWSRRTGYGSWDDFMMEFKRHRWEERSPSWPESYFDRTTDSEIHAEIVRFDGKGMLLGPIDRMRVEWFLRSTRVPRYKPEKRRISATEVDK